MSWIIKRLFNEVRAFKSYRKIKRISAKYPDYIIFVAVQGIGDICYHFAYLRELKHRFNKKILVVSSSYSKELVSFYPEIDKLIYLSPKQSLYCKLLSYPHFACRLFNNGNTRNSIYTCNHWLFYSYRIMNIPNVTYLDVLRVVNYELGYDKFELTFPKVPDCDISHLGINDFEKTIILNPYSNSMILEEEIFTNICLILQKKGYKVFTNVTPRFNKAIEGSKPILCSLNEFYTIVKKVKLVISIRSGLLDFAISAGGRMLVIYNVENSEQFRKAYCLNDWNTDSDIKEICNDQTELLYDFVNEL